MKTSIVIGGLLMVAFGSTKLPNGAKDACVAALGAAGDEACGRISSGNDCGATCTVTCDSTKSDDGSMVLAVRIGGDSAATSASADAVAIADVWIGIRVTPVPEALAAHIGSDGLMIANLVADSPADRAGLERYDVILDFDGTPVREMQDLVSAIQEVGAGAPAEITVIRGAKEKTLEIKPEARSASGELDFKYDEPEAAKIDDSVRYFGGKLKLGPNDKWIHTPLGQLKQLPDSIKDLLGDMDGPAWHLQLKDLKDLHDMPFRGQIDLGDDDGIAKIFIGKSLFDGDDDSDAKSELRLKMERDGETVVIERSDDGSIDVERTDADGNVSSESYGDLDELKEADPDAYKLLNRQNGFRLQPMISLPPNLKNLPDLQIEFQDGIEKQIERLRDRLRNLNEQLDDDDSVGHKRVLRRRTRADDDDDAGSANESISISVDNGRIKITVDEDDESKTYEFDNEDAFEQAEPQLYKRFKKMLPEPPATPRSQLGVAWSGRVA